MSSSQATGRYEISATQKVVSSSEALQILIALFTLSFASTLFALYSGGSLTALQSPLKFFELLVGMAAAYYFIQRYAYLNWEHIFRTHFVSLLYIAYLMFDNVLALKSSAGSVSAIGYSASIVIFFIFLPIFLVATSSLATAMVIAVGFGVLATLFVFLTALGMRSFLGLPLHSTYAGILPFFVSGGGGLLRDHITYGSFATPCVAAAIYLYRTTRQTIYAVAAWFIGSGVFVAQSRGAFIGMLICLLVLYVPARFKRGFLRWSVGGGAALLIGGAILILLLKIPAFADYFRVSKGGSAREYSWLLCLLAIAKHPWIGYGSGQSQFVYEQMGGNILGAYGVPIGSTANNTFLTSAVENGIPSVFLYLLILLNALRIALADKLPAVLKDYFIMSCLSSLFMMIFEDMNIGGVKLNSLMLTLSIGTIFAFQTIKSSVRIDRSRVIEAQRNSAPIA